MRKYHWPVTSLEIAITNRVIAGICASPPISLNTPANTGTMKATMPSMTTIAKLRMTIG